MSEAFYILWQGGLLVFWFWMGSFVAGNKSITDQWRYEWLNRATKFLAVPAFALIVAFVIDSGVGDEWNRQHQAVWLVRGFAGFCGAFWCVVLRR